MELGTRGQDDIEGYLAMRDISGVTTFPYCIRSAIAVFAFVLPLSLEVPDLRAEEQCKGSARRSHDLGKYHFTTTSRVYRKDGAEWYETCVENSGKRWLWIDWYVPGPNSYVPPEETVSSPRTFDTRETSGLEGCLEYGNLADTIHEHFLGHVSDIAAINNEKKKDCDYWAAASTGDKSKNLDIQNLNVPFRIFLPSNRKYALSTMLMMKGEAKIVWNDAENYSTVLEYTVEKIEGQGDGNADNIFLRPVDKGIAGEYLRKAFYNTFLKQFGDKGIPLRWKNKFSLSLDLPRKPSLMSTRYGFFDESGEFVGAVFVPLWVPIAQ